MPDRNEPLSSRSAAATRCHRRPRTQRRGSPQPRRRGLATIEYCLILSFICLFTIIGLQRLSPTVISAISKIESLTILLKDDDPPQLEPPPKTERSDEQ